MNIRSLVVALALGSAATLAVGQTTPPAPAPAAAPATSLKTDKERQSYALGLQVGMSFKDIDLDYTALAAGLKDAATNAKLQLTDKEIEDNLAALKKVVQEKAQAEEANLAADNIKAGAAYLADNAKKDGVKVTASGLQYKVIKAGAGKSPKATDTVSVNYRGTLISGKEFDASRGSPVSFPVNQVIPGWTEALQLMKEGDKWQLTIPSKLAYAERGAGQDIGPNAVLVFEVELLKVEAGR